MKYRFHAAGICDCCEAPTCVDCGEVVDFQWFDGRCSSCGDAKYDREHPYAVEGTTHREGPMRLDGDVEPCNELTVAQREEGPAARPTTGEHERDGATARPSSEYHALVIA